MTAGRRQALVAAGLGLVALVSVLVAQRDHGVARDETVYFSAATRYVDWWSDLVHLKGGTLSRAAITSHFGGPQATDNNREHPPFVKTLFGLSERLLHRGLGVATEVSAFRAPTALLNALTVVMIFLFGAALWSEAVGVLAALLFLLLPRGFYHAGLATFDGPMVTLWFATVVAYYRALASRRWCVGLAVAFGLALATKHNAIMLPAVLLPHYAFVAWRRGRAGGVRGVARALWSTQPWLLPALAGGFVVLFAVWPWLWIDPFGHLGQWLAFHLHHVNYNYEYLGHDWNAPPFPWHVVFVTTLFVVPVATLGAALGGGALLVVRARRGQAADPERAPALLLLGSLAVAMGVFLLPSTPIFGAEKHWAPAMPSLCLFAAIGIVAAAERLATGLGRGRLVAVGGLGGLVVLASAVETWRAEPYGLSHYNALAGGAIGGADHGMNRQFWGVSARAVLPFLDEQAAAGGKPQPVYSHDAQPAWGWYKKLGLLASGLPDSGKEDAGVRGSTFALVIHELHFNRHDYMIWQDYGTVQPVLVFTTDGVPIVSVYQRPPPAARPSAELHDEPVRAGE